MKLSSSFAVIDLAPRKRERVSFRKFARIVRTHRNDIASVETVFPRLGTKGFGSVEVDYTHPIYESQASRRSK